MNKFLEEFLARTVSGTILTQLVKANGSSVQTFITGAVVGVFPDVHLNLYGVHFTWTDKDIRRFLTDLKTKNWHDMVVAAEEALKG